MFGSIADAVFSSFFFRVFLCSVCGGVRDDAGDLYGVTDVLAQSNRIALNFPVVALRIGQLVFLIAVALL